ncbi:hypothetical protein [Wolbachia endosymbiont of Pentidionis agamae]|uniref:hypothetical protein n=1 Tax=Wolbachia endosymbiont of Pentidionis agamae TaxID=3110435 RepID=UPI002FD1840D
MILFGCSGLAVIAIYDLKTTLLIDSVYNIRNALSEKRYSIMVDKEQCMTCNIVIETVDACEEKNKELIYEYYKALNTNPINASQNGMNIDESQRDGSWEEENKKKFYEPNELKRIELSKKENIMPILWKDSIPLPWKNINLSPETKLETAALEPAVQQGENMQCIA